jgi:hypothetical protein
MPNLFVTPGASVVRYTPELARVADLPRRSWTPAETEDLASRMTEILKTPTGTMRLRPVQALALYDVGTCDGLFAPMAVGSGKTLVSFLAPEMRGAQRPVLLVPAKLVDKTDRDRRILSRHWKIAPFLRVMTYEFLGQPQNAEALEKFKPDFLVADEGHKLRNTDAAVTRRVRRFFSEQRVPFIVMSGTMTKRSLLDFAHLMRWVYANDLEQMPLPRNHHDLEIWADAVDERKGQVRRADPGALECLYNEVERERSRTDRRGAARSAIRRRLVETAGIVATTETPVDATLAIEAVEPPQPGVIEEAFRKLRKDWQTPDDWPLTDAIEVRRHALELALGMYYVWDPRPPDIWIDRRRAWAKYCRKVLSHSKKLDTEAQVRKWAQERGDCAELSDWLAVRDMFEPNTRPVWLTDEVAKFVADWAREERGIVWVEHVALGEKLEREFGLPYYGRQGRDRSGRYIEDHPADEPMVASIASSGEGRNLQAWNKNLVTSWPANGKGAEQLLGRTHREGQSADEVYVEFFATCAEHLISFWQSHSDCRYVLDTTGSQQKLLLASANVTGLDGLRAGHPRWDRDFRED